MPLFTAQLVLFSPDTYVSAIDSSAALTRLPDAAAAQLYLSMHYQGAEGGAEPGGEGGPPPALRSLSEDQFRSLFRTLLPADAVRPIADSFFRSLFAAASGSSDPVTVSFASLKERLSSGAAVDAYVTLMRAQPACSEAQLPTVLAKAATELPTCSPPESAIAELRPAIQTALAGVVSGIPDRQAMSDAIGADTRRALSTSRTVLLLSPLVPIVFLLLTAAFGARSRRGLLRWWGAVFALAGGAVAAFAIALPGLVEQRWSASVAPQLPPYWSPLLLGLGHDVATAVVVAFSIGLALVSGVVAVIGLASLIVAARLGRAATGQAPVPAAGVTEPNS